MTKTLVLGIGNTVMGDDAVGVRVIEALHQHHGFPNGVDVLDAGTSSFDVVPEVALYDRVIIVDAAEFRAPAGAIRCWEDEKADAFLRARRRTAHEVGLAEIVDLARLSGWEPQAWAVVGIQPQAVELGEGLSPAVAAAVPEAVQEICRLLAKWRG